MAYTSGTSKSNFLTPRKFVKGPGLSDRNHFTALNTPKNNSQTPKRGAKIPLEASNTPECFSKVVLETPNSALKQRNSKEKCDEISNLTVAVRIRPMNARELACIGAANVVKVRDKDIIIRSNPIGNSSMSVDHIFQYDHIFWSCDEESPRYSSQDIVYRTIGQPLLGSAFRGYNACLFAYGQTGSGKSFSMMGSNNCENIDDIDCEQFSGLIPRFCRDLFKQISQLSSEASATVEVSYFEIYNEKIHDLLSIQSTDNRMALKVREHPVWGPYVVDLSVHKVKNYMELRNWLVLGNKRRATAATSMNEKSSRSHSIFSIELCLTEGVDRDCSRRSKVSLVDLAGSERLSNSHGSDEKIKQGVCINKSLLTLGKVISSLADQKKNHFVPYRESVLTWLLKESLGGNSLSSMLATISPSNSNIDETLATLRYACQARSIVNRARINENPHDRLIRELRLEVERLRALKQNYERSSLSCSLTSHASSSSLNSTEELEELRGKLSETENRLIEAEVSWQQKFLETKKQQLQELAEAERLREELESRVRVMQTAEKEIKLSPFRSNFLEELENVLLSEDTKHESYEKSELINDIRTWCSQNTLETLLAGDSLIIRDHRNRKQTTLLFSEMKDMEGYENISDYIHSLQWTVLKKTPKKMTKPEVMSTMNRIYSALATIQPSESDRDLNLLYAKVNKSLQSFETALMNELIKNHVTKTVTFNIKLEKEEEDR